MNRFHRNQPLVEQRSRVSRPKAPSRPLALSWLVAFALTPSAARATRYPTGQSHRVYLHPAAHASIEATMPRTGDYAVAIAADRARDWGEAVQAYRSASARFQRLLQAQPERARTIRLWIAKAEHQRQQSERLRQDADHSQGHWSWRQRYGYPYNTFNRASALHTKWLAIRAFSGESDRALAQRAISDYRHTLRERPSYSAARLRLAGLLHELGRDEEARQVFHERSPSRISRWVAFDAAYYYCAAGQTAKALDQLARALRYSTGARRLAQHANEFDSLRRLPRFLELVSGKGN